MNAEESIAAEVRKAFAGRDDDFRPFVSFDEPLDCIRVVSRDCSTTEIRIDNQLTVLEDMYFSPDRGSKYVGFTIKGAKHFCKKRGFDLSAPVRLTAILDEIVRDASASVVEIVVDSVVRPMVKNIKEQDIPEEVSFSSRAA